MTPQQPQTLVVQGPDGPLMVDRWGQHAGADKPVLVLVHGYPDNRSMWAPVAQALAKDFVVIAYDVRGAGGSFRPKSRRDYRLSQLCQDFTAVIDALSPHAPVHLAAHDWGSVQSWEFATDARLRGRILSFTSCSGPCLDHMGHWVRQQWRRPGLSGWPALARQLLKSWYVFFFHLPVLPELLWYAVSGPAWPLIMRTIERTQLAPRPTQSADGAHGVNLYRANVWSAMVRPRQRVAHCRVQVLVPVHDHFLSPGLSEGLQQWAPRLQRQLLQAGHWLPLAQPERFAKAIASFALEPAQAQQEPAAVQGARA